MCITKNILMFITEVFKSAKEIKLHDSIITLVIPMIMLKSFSKQKMIRTSAEMILSYFAKYCLYNSS